MKKAFYFILFVFFCLNYVNAGNPVIVKSGKFSALKNCGDIIYEFDYSEATIDGKPLLEYFKGRGEDFLRDWPINSKAGESGFAAMFNKKNKLGINMVENSSNAKYKLLVKVSKLDIGNSAGTFVPFAGAKAGGVILWGTAVFTDISSGDAVVSLAIDEVKGTGSPSEKVRMVLTYSTLATTMCKLK